MSLREKQETFSSWLLSLGQQFLIKERQEGFQIHTVTAAYLQLLHLQPHLVQLLLPGTELADSLVGVQCAALLHPHSPWGSSYRFGIEIVGLQSCWHHPAPAGPRPVPGLAGSVGPRRLFALWQHLVMVLPCLRARVELLAPVQGVRAQIVQKERLVKGLLHGRSVELPGIFCPRVLSSRRPGVLTAILPRGPVETQEVPGGHLRGLPGVQVPVPGQPWAVRGRGWQGRALGTALLPCRAQLGGRGAQRGRHNVGCWNGHLGFDGME